MTTSKSGTVLSRCEKCGKIVERPAARAGVLYSCGNCQHVQRTTSILTQEQATGTQLNFIEGALRWHRRAFIALIALLIINLAIILFSFLTTEKNIAATNKPAVSAVIPDQPTETNDENKISIIAMVIVALAVSVQLFLLACEQRSIECLGYSKGTSFVLFFIVWPVWLIRSIVVFFRVRSSYKRLKNFGPRIDQQAGQPA